MKIAFVVGTFPKVSETFIIDQACDLIDRGVDVFIYAFGSGDKNKENISKRYFEYDLDKKTAYLNTADNKLSKTLLIFPRFVGLFFLKPSAILSMLSGFSYFKILSWDVRLFLNNKHDLYHCHFGVVGARFAVIRKVLGIKEKFITSLYGQDVSMAIKKRGIGMYKELMQESSKFFVMSENMKQRVVAHGFLPDKVLVHPIGINIAEYPYSERRVGPDGQVNIISVGRFVEKKGFDDLMRALALVKEKTSRKFRCYIVGGGPLKDKIYSLVKSLKIDDVVEFRGFMPIDKILNLFKDMHFFVQPSKTAQDGDME